MLFALIHESFGKGLSTSSPLNEVAKHQEEFLIRHGHFRAISPALTSSLWRRLKIDLLMAKARRQQP
jgi:hypothetical protein